MGRAHRSHFIPHRLLAGPAPTLVTFGGAAGLVRLAVILVIGFARWRVRTVVGTVPYWCISKDFFVELKEGGTSAHPRER